MLEIAVSTEQIGIMNGDIFEILNRINEAGFRYVDFNAGNYAQSYMDWGSTEFLSDEWREWIQSIRRHADGLGLKFVQSHNLIFNYFDKKPNTEALLKGVERAIEACAILDAGISVMHPVQPPDSDPETWMDMNVKFFRRCGLLAESFGVKIAIENMIAPMTEKGVREGGFGTRPDQLIELVERIGLENVGICLDTGHANCMGEDIEQLFVAYGDRLMALHINDNDGSNDLHLAVGDGRLKWKMFTKEIEDYQMDTTVLVEVTGVEKQKKSLEYMTEHSIYPLV